MKSLILPGQFRTMVWIASGLLCILFLNSCIQTGEIMLTENDNGQQVELSQGQELIISLESNPSTGYGWQVAEIDETILKPVGEPDYFPAGQTGQPVVGAGGKEVLRFSAEAPGTTELSLVYVRPWETGGEPAKTFSVEVVVR